MWTPKSLINLSWPSRGAQRRTRPPGGLQRAISEPFGTHFGAIFGPMLEPFWDPRWNNFGSILKRRRLVTRLPYHSCYQEVPETQGQRVPALALTIIQIKTLIVVFSTLLAGSIRLINLWLSNKISFGIGSDIGCLAYNNILYQDYP